MTDKDKELIQNLMNCLQSYVREYPAFRSKPIGAPNSDMRKQQEIQIEIEDNARKLLYE